LREETWGISKQKGGGGRANTLNGGIETKKQQGLAPEKGRIEKQSKLARHAKREKGPKSFGRGGVLPGGRKSLSGGGGKKTSHGKGGRLGPAQGAKDYA